MGVIRTMATCTSRQDLNSYLLTTSTSSNSYQHRVASLQLAELVSTIRARKANSGLPEQSSTRIAAAQALIEQQQQQDKASLSQQQTAKTSFARRYSRSQAAGQDDDTFDPDALLHKFNSSLTFSSYSQKTGKDDNNSSSTTTSLSPDSELSPDVLQRYFGRRRSSPDVGSLSQLRAANNLQLTEKIAAATSSSSTSSQGQTLGVVSRMANSKGIDKSASFSNLQTALVTGKGQAATAAGDTKSTSMCPQQRMELRDSVDSHHQSLADPSSSSNYGFGILSRTRKFGAWLTKATEGEKVEVTKKDLNAFAPTSF